MKGIRISLIAILLVCLLLTPAMAAEQADDPICMYYFSGIGCPHCSNVDPVMFGDWMQEYPDLVIIKYEIYQHADNVPIFRAFVSQFGISPGVPNLLMGINGSVSGDTPILNTLPGIMENRANITAQYGNVFFALDQCPFAQLSGSPQIWNGDRVLIKTGTESADDAFLKGILLSEDLYTALQGSEYEEVDPFPVNISGGAVPFEHAVAVEGWTLQWNGEELSPPETAVPTTTPAAPLAWYIGIAAIGMAAIVAVGKRG
jgi:hypothetical protein